MEIKPWNLLKLTSYFFAGTSNDVDVYFEWEHRMNTFFFLCGCPEFEKVSIAAAQLIDDAQTWWNKEINEGKYSGFVKNPTWEVMQNLLRKQYVPREQYQDIRKQFRTLRQGDKTIMEYQSQFNYLRIRLNPGVSNEVIMNQFEDGLNADIKYQLQVCKCNKLEELLQQTIEIEDLRTNPFEEGEYDEVMKSEVLKEKSDYEFIIIEQELRSMKLVESQGEKVHPTSTSSHEVKTTKETKKGVKIELRINLITFKRNKDCSLFDFSPTTQPLIK